MEMFVPDFLLGFIAAGVLVAVIKLDRIIHLLNKP